MKKLLLTALGALSLAAEAQATSYTYLDMIDYHLLGVLSSSGPNTRSGTFNINAGGSGGDVITVTNLGGGGPGRYSDHGVTYTDVDGFDYTTMDAVDGFVS